jgi:hypothetical protein
MESPTVHHISASDFMLKTAELIGTRKCCCLLVLLSAGMKWQSLALLEVLHNYLLKLKKIEML